MSVDTTDGDAHRIENDHPADRRHSIVAIDTADGGAVLYDEDHPAAWIKSKATVTLLDLQ